MDEWLRKQGVKLCKKCNRILWAGDPDYCPDCKPEEPPKPKKQEPQPAPDKQHDFSEVGPS